MVAAAARGAHNGFNKARQFGNGILTLWTLSRFSSAWAGLLGGATVDEVEAVRTSQRGASRVHHYPEKIAHKTRR